MKLFLSYSLKVWLTTLGIAFVAMLGMVFYRLSKPDHSKELDPFFATIAFIIINILFLPAWIVFTFSTKFITKRVSIGWKQKISLCIVAFILIAFTVTPFVVVTYPDLSYYEIGLWYLLCMIVSIWIYNPTSLSKMGGDLNNSP